jgi:hypothetical protein
MDVIIHAVPDFQYLTRPCYSQRAIPDQAFGILSAWAMLPGMHR